jgi:hypothetical protein
LKPPGGVVYKDSMNDEDNDETISFPSDFNLDIYKEDEKGMPRGSAPLNSEEKHLQERNPNILKSEYFKLQVSSFVLATNSFGDFSKCTIISEEIDGEELKAIANQAQALWQVFAHQPQTARCLVFFLILGQLVRNMIEQYRHVFNVLRSVLDLDVSSNLFQLVECDI